MLKNYLKTALRNLWKRKLFTAIHIVGMGIAFGVAIVLFIVAANQLTYDHFHAGRKDLHLLYFETHRPQQVESSANMPVPLAPALKREISQVEDVARIATAATTSRVNKKELGLSTAYVDASFLRMFTFPLIRGNTSSALNDVESAVLTESAAKKLYGDADPLGKLLEINANGQWHTYTVSGVAKDLPNNSSMMFDVLLRFERSEGYAANSDKWSNMTHNVFVKLRKGSDPAQLTRSAQTFIRKYFADEITSLKRDGAHAGADGQFINLKTVPLSELHFTRFAGLGNPVSKVLPWLLIVLSLFILFIASTNFINLSLAGSFNRSREIGMRKTMGASRWNILGQLWGESMLTCLLALLLGALISRWVFYYFSAQMQNPLSLKLLFAPQVLGWFLLLFFTVTAFAGGYPALVMSKFNTILTLKGALKMSSRNRLRSVLITIQFVIAILMITATLVVSSQVRYLMNKPLGYNKNQVISIPIGNEIEPETALSLMRSKLAGQPGIGTVTATDINLGRGKDGSSYSSMIGFDFRDHTVKTNWLRVDHDYLKTLDIKLVAGRDFSSAYTDSGSVLINETMAAALGVKDPVGADLNVLSGLPPLRVIGVVKDFHFRSLHDEIQPLTMTVRTDWPARYIFVKVGAAHLPASMARVKDAWNGINRAPKDDPTFLDENTNRLYKGEEMLGQLFSAGSILTILISCMGLFAIALFMMEQRTREIGVRKVLGASVSGVIAMLSASFVRLVTIAFVIAAPLSWFLLQQWLQSFAYRVPLHWYTVAAGGLAVLLIALVTVGFQATRAALANPVRSLRSE